VGGDDDDDYDVFLWSSTAKFCSCSFGNQFQVILWNRNFRWPVYKMPPVAPVLSKFNPIHTNSARRFPLVPPETLMNNVSV